MNKKFSAEEDRRLIELYHQGLSQSKIAEEMQRPRTSVKDRGISLGLDWDYDRRLAGAAELREIDDLPYLQPAQVVVEPREKQALIDNLPRCWVVYGDVHFPFHDPAAVECLYRVVDMLEVDGIVDLGDLSDNWQISDFIPPDERKLTDAQKDLGEQFRMASQHLGQLTQLTPGAERRFLKGNHEERWERMLRKAQTDYKWRHVLQLPQIQQIFDIHWLLGLGSAGWKGLEPGQKELIVGNRIVMFHGDRATKWVTRQQLERYGKSCMFGHTHRVQNWVKRDLKATEAAWNIGCLCDMDPHYGDSSAVDWAQGFAVIVADDDFRHYNVIQLRVHWGICATPWGIIKA